MSYQFKTAEFHDSTISMVSQTDTPLMASSPGQPGTRKVKAFSMLMKQEMMG